jgi:hypothetical protein
MQAVQITVARCPPDLLSTRFRGSCHGMAADPDPATVAGSPTVAGYLHDWLGHMAGRVRPKTLDGYRGLIRL